MRQRVVDVRRARRLPSVWRAGRGHGCAARRGRAHRSDPGPGRDDGRRADRARRADRGRSGRATGPRYALSFDGDGDEIEFPFDIGDPGTHFTFEMWVRPTSSTPGSSEGEGGSLFVHRGDCADFWLEWSGTVERRPDRFRFTVYPVAGCGHQVSAESEATSMLSEWHHVAGVFDDGVVRLYVDGTLAATTTQSIPISWTTRALGHWAGRDGYDPRPNRQAFIGDIDEIRVSSIARYAGSSFTPPEHLDADVDTLAAWLLDEGSGTSALDDGAGARDGAIVGATWIVSTR